jgi:EF-hand domain-containing protein 1
MPGKDDTVYVWTDLCLGMNLNVYGRVFRIVDCDDFTRQFYADQGAELGVAESFPDDKFATTRAMINFKQNPPDLAEHKNYIEVLLKGGRPNKNLQSFRANDRNVLSFRIRWSDTSYDGGEKFYTLNFFLSD